ncbi:hypothetical protein MKW98_015359 [Papaver atlanticum]|uniref:Uncharacterized protein n=1 Tax=Papaver atlanticum TaxID=357466 RepID=A0AAD4X5X3_9MAGN|nr:hypothetical protein MKW98_015359 [Papaver atlanticum]
MLLTQVKIKRKKDLQVKKLLEENKKENKERVDLPGRISPFCWMGSSVCGSLVEVFELWKLLPVSAPYDLNIHIMDFQPWKFLNVQQEHRRLTSNGTMLHLSRYLQILNWQLIQLSAFFFAAVYVY